jgi:hypothetical protein
MDLKKFNFLIMSTHGRAKTMAPLLLDHVQKMDLAKTGLFFYNNLFKCIGCSTTMDKIDTKLVKRHTYSDYCISATNALLANESLRKQSFSSFKWARRQFESHPRVVDMLSRRGYYCFGKRLRCAGCKAVVAYESVDAAQRGHDAVCTFRHVVDVDLNECTFKVLAANLPPPRLERAEPSAPQADAGSSVSECKVCFANEKSVCFMPCRHLAVCAICSPRCKRCCVCNGKIVSRIETLPQ